MTENIAGYNLSNVQKRYWSFLEKGHVLNNQLSIVFKGDLDQNKLENALNEVIKTNEALRTTFSLPGGVLFPLQVVHQHQHVAIIYQDLSHLDLKETEESINKTREEARLKTYDFEKEAATDFILIKRAKEDFVLIIQASALCCDTRSLFNIVKAIEVNYEADATMAEEEVFQYAQYSEWNNELLEEEDTEAKTFWQDILSAKKPLQIPFGTQQTALKGLESHSIALEPSLISEINQFTEKQACTLETFFAVVWEAVTTQYLATDDKLHIGFVGHGRSYEAFEEIIGSVAKTLPLVVNVNKGTVQEVLEDMSSKIEALRDWQDYYQIGINEAQDDIPFEVIYEFVEFKNYQEQQVLKITLDEWCTEETFHLKLSVLQQADGIKATLHSRAGFYEQLALETIKEHLVNKIKTIVQNPESTLEQLISPSAEERHLLLNEFHEQEVNIDTETPIIQCVENQTLKTPDNIALTSKEESLTYRQLNDKVNQIANYLRDHYEVTSNDVIAIKLPRSIEMIVSLLGVLKAGATFLPIEVTSPDQRAKFMLEDSEAKLLITNQAFNDWSTPQLNIDQIWNVLDEKSSKYTSHKVADKAYIIYTSGSTGQPKGVTISNSSLMNYVGWFKKSFNISAKDKTLLISSMAYDLGYTSFWATLLSGGELCIYSEEGRYDPQLLLKDLIDNKITFIKLTPSHFKLIVEDPEYEDKIMQYSMRLIVLGGESINTKDVEKYLSDRGEVTFVNHYGPTETTIGTAACTINQENFEDFKGRPHIGKPVTNNKIYILNDNEALRPIGVAGEICVTGSGVAQGYLNRPELSAQKFVVNPFDDQGILYKTGDLGRWTINGNIEFLGRKDGQIKLRGHRIELSEIEVLLQQQEDVLEARVLVVDQNEDKLLGCYMKSEKELDVDQLRKHLSETLPVHMIPNYFVRVNAFPLTPNGKLDIAALPKWDSASESTSEKYIAPQTDIEKSLSEIWKEVLGKDTIGIKDNFFAIGGHSLRAIQVISRVLKQFQVRIDLRNFFAEPTIEGLAKLMEQSEKVSYAEIPLIEKQDYYEVSHAQKRLWILDHVENEQLAYNISGAYALQGDLNEKALHDAFKTLVERHEILRTTFIAIDDEPKQVVHSVDEIDFGIEQENATDLGDAEVQQLIENEIAKNFDLEKGPLLRAKLIQTQVDHYTFLFTIHHIICDAWSIEILLNEVVMCYEAFKNNQPNDLPPLRIHYKEYSAWHNALLQSDKVLKGRKYWLDQFKGVLPTLELSSDFPRPKVKSYNGDTVGFFIDKSSTVALHRIKDQYDATLYMILISCMNVLLYRYTGQEDIILGSPISGRVHNSLENQIGLFLNNIAIRTRFEGSNTFDQLVSNVKEVVISAYEHMTYPFDSLVSDLNIKRNISRSPLFDVVVVLQNAKPTPEGVQEMQNLGVIKFDSGFRQSTIDLRFSFTESNDIIYGQLDYNTDLYTASTMEELCDKFKMLVKEVAEDHKIKIFSILSKKSTADSMQVKLATKFNFK